MEFEGKLKRLGDIVQEMESSDPNLDRAIQLFEEGVKLTKECQKALDKAEQKVRLLVGEDTTGTPQYQEFKTNDAET